MSFDFNSLCNIGNREDGVSEVDWSLLFDARLFDNPTKKTNTQNNVSAVKALVARLSLTCYLHLIFLKQYFLILISLYTDLSRIVHMQQLRNKKF